MIKKNSPLPPRGGGTAKRWVRAGRCKRRHRNSERQHLASTGFPARLILKQPAPKMAVLAEFVLIPKHIAASVQMRLLNLNFLWT